ncbi:5-(carboxyamino)imidazole ribonucleotide synthase [Raineyella antarctica]|uniref:5-(carboxyamino)imidazole ribonucleotide synthase n=1 Tax=Raineyella antarctica TaxID=1577474 RepID=UPI002481FD9A|nr:5-(carboxyamino)imidazole ribonucleotide synthase [Raineyella antarctica]
MSDARPFVVGIIGGGQLARMMYGPAIRLGLHVKLLAEAPGVSAAQVAHDVEYGDYTDPATVLAFAEGCDAITFDHEHVPTTLLQQLEERGIAVRPGSAALVHAQDKVVMRERLSALGMPCPAFQVVASAEELAAFGERIGWPVIAKTSRGGYDGKGVWKIDGPQQAGEPFEALASGEAGGGTTAGSGTSGEVQILAEEFVDFTRELSALVVRSPSGQGVTYPVSETYQDRGICAETLTPAPGLTDERAVATQQMALRIAEELGVVGVLAVELMEARDGRILVNELAMRPHNTGHWSIDGAHTSQFENHLRAIADLPLGDPASRASWTVMVNVLGGSREDLADGLLHVLSRDPQLKVELYGKAVKARRKVGHVTAYGPDLEDVRARAQHAAQYLMGDLD